MFSNLRVAIVYDWIDKWGGVERVLLELHRMFPKAQFYSSYVDREKAPWAKDIPIKTSFIQKFPDFVNKNRLLSFFFYPYAFESFDFTGFDLVISITSSFAKSIITKPGTIHICYLLTPTRFLWVYPEIYLKNKIVKILAAPIIKRLKNWDLVSSQRPDHIISISKTVGERCTKYYKRESEVIYPPFDEEYWRKIKHEARNTKLETNSNFKLSKYFLIVSRLEPYKRVDLAVKVFNKRTDLNLVIVGDGTERNNLKKQAGKNIYFLEKITDEELGLLYSRSEALVMPQEEDFGYVALEAQFFGCPVIAYRNGGASETIIDGRTGIFFDVQSTQSIARALERFEKIAYNLKACTKRLGSEQVVKFDRHKFEERFIQFVNSKLKLKQS